MSVAERADPERQASLDTLQALPEIGAAAPIGCGGVMLGVATGLMLTAVESRIAGDGDHAYHPRTVRVRSDAPAERVRGARSVGTRRRR